MTADRVCLGFRLARLTARDLAREVAASASSVFAPGKPEHAIDLEREVGLSQEEQGECSARLSAPAIVGPTAVVLLPIEQDLGAARVPVEPVERAQAERHADAFERPEVVDVRLVPCPAGVLANGASADWNAGSAASAAPRAARSAARPGSAWTRRSPGPSDRRTTSPPFPAY